MTKILVSDDQEVMFLMYSFDLSFEFTHYPFSFSYNEATFNIDSLQVCPGLAQFLLNVVEKGMNTFIDLYSIDNYI